MATFKKTQFFTILKKEKLFTLVYFAYNHHNRKKDILENTLFNTVVKSNQKRNKTKKILFLQITTNAVLFLKNIT